VVTSLAEQPFRERPEEPARRRHLCHSAIDASHWRKIDEVPFDFERRRVSVLVDTDGVRMLLVKGAPEDVIRISTHMERADGASVELTEEQRDGLHAQFEQLSAEGFRLLGIGEPSRAGPSERPACSATKSG